MALCMGCMAEIGRNTTCPYCGFKTTEKQRSPFLPYSTIIGGRYLVGRVIEINGESTSYIGYDRVQNKIIMIKEFLPAGFFVRKKGEIRLKPVAEKQDKFFKLLSEFKEYFIQLSEFADLTCMPRIHNIFEENNSCYVIENYEPLIPLEDYLDECGGYLEWDKARLLFMPLVTLLEAFHRRGIGHYGVAPKNIYVTKHNKLKIYGFATENERKRGTPLRSQLYTGFSAPEQYITGENLTIETDIYGITATLFYVLTGTVPESASKRLVDGKLLLGTSIVKRIPPHVVVALANGLQIGRSKRTSDFDTLRNQVSASSAVKAIQEEISRTTTLNKIEYGISEAKKKNGNGVATVLISSILTTIALSVILFVFFFDDMILGTHNNEISVSTKNTALMEQLTVTDSAASTEAGEVALSNFVGLDYESASDEAENTGVILYKSAEPVYNDEVPMGKIISQYPVQGTLVDSKSGNVAVYVEVSSGSLMRELPDIENLTLKEAAQKIADAGLLATAKRVEDSGYDSGTVLGYDGYKSKDKIEVGSTVTIIVAQ